MSTITSSHPAGATYDFVAAPEVLRLTSVSKHFDTRNGRVQALSPVSLSIRERQFTFWSYRISPSRPRTTSPIAMRL